MRRVRIPNPIVLNNEQTFIDADYTGGDPIVVVSSFTFATNDMIIAGNTGEKKTELGYLNSLTAPATLNLTNPFNFDHNKGTILYRADYDYVSVEGTAPNSSTFNQIAFIPLQYDKLQTIYVHFAGTDDWTYRIRFWNSVQQQWSEYAPTVPGSGFTRGEVGKLVINVRRKIRDINRDRYSDEDIIDLLNDAQNDACAEIDKLWFLYVDTWETATINGDGPLIDIGKGMLSTAHQTSYSFNQWTDIKYVDKIKYYYNLNGAFLLWDLQPLASVDFDRFLYNQVRIKNDVILSCKILPPTSTNPYGSFEVDPMPLNGGGVFYPVYWRNPTPITNIGDITDFPFPQMLEDYAAWRIHSFMGNSQEAATYEALYYGPSSETADQKLTGIKLLQKYNNHIRRVNGYGRQLWNFRGKRGTGNFFGKGIVSRDFYKEQYF
ncbi:MAG: hypothetical protein ACRDFB_03690 [Rhabdochlamydiaceae bacterium]